MTNLTSVHITDGVPDDGTGDVSTIDALIAEIEASAVATGSQQFPSSSYLSAVVGGDIAHDAADSAVSNPIKLGAVAIAHGTNPTAVAAADRTKLYANRAGVLFVVGGHPNIITRDNVVLASDGAQTNAALLSVSTGAKIVITQRSVLCDARNTVNVAVRVGFGTASVPAAALAGTAGILINGVFAAKDNPRRGDGSGIIAVGADAEDLRITCDSPTSGAIYVTYSYYTIES